MFRGVWRVCRMLKEDTIQMTLRFVVREGISSSWCHSGTTPVPRLRRAQDILFSPLAPVRHQSFIANEIFRCFRAEGIGRDIRRPGCSTGEPNVIIRQLARMPRPAVAVQAPDSLWIDSSRRFSAEMAPVGA